MSLRLWNIATKKDRSEVTDRVACEARRMAVDLLSVYAGDDVEQLLLLAEFAARTGRAYLDSGTEPEVTASLFQLSSETLAHLEDHRKQQSLDSTIAKGLLDLRFRLGCWKAELHAAVGDFDRALQSWNGVEALQPEVGANSLQHAAMVSWNLGVQFYKDKRLELAEAWLNASAAMAGPERDRSRQSRTLRLLAVVQIQLNKPAEAERNFQVALAEFDEPRVHLELAKLHALKGNPAAGAHFDRCLDHPLLSSKVGVGACQEIAEAGRPDLAFSGFDRLISRFDSIAFFWVKKMELAITLDRSDIVDQALSLLSNGTMELDAVTQKRLQ
jgi:tetratricopeptide (TPR) repeat protein